jgi:Domain of unknown function (DUF4191)
MAKDPTAAPKGTRSARRKNAKAAKQKVRLGERLRQIREVYRITRQSDRSLPLWMALAFFGTLGVVLLVLTLVGSQLYFRIPISVLTGFMALMFVFGRRVQKSAYRRVEGQPGAAAWALQQIDTSGPERRPGVRGDWRVTQAVALNPQMDAVHRVLGRPGVVLVAEGAPHRARALLAQEKKRVARVAGDTPIYDIVVGDDEGEVPLRGLTRYFNKLPRNLSAAQVNALEKRLQALGGSKAAPLPKGPLPKGARLAGLERTLRRR